MMMMVVVVAVCLLDTFDAIGISCLNYQFIYSIYIFSTILVHSSQLFEKDEQLHGRVQILLQYVRDLSLGGMIRAFRRGSVRLDVDLISC